MSSTANYKVIFTGDIVDGLEPETVKANLQKLMKSPLEKVEALFSGKPVVIKQTDDRTVAERYSGAFAKAGAICKVAEETPEILEIDLGGTEKLVSDRSPVSPGDSSIKEHGAILEQGKAESRFWSFGSWFLGIIFGFGGVGALQDGLLPAFAMFAAAGFCLPPVRRLVYKTTGKRLTFTNRVLAVFGIFVLLGVIVEAMKSETVKNVRSSDRTSQVSSEAINNYNANWKSIHSKAKKAIAEERYNDAIKIADEFRFAASDTLKAIRMQAEAGNAGLPIPKIEEIDKLEASINIEEETHWLKRFEHQKSENHSKSIPSTKKTPKTVSSEAAQFRKEVDEWVVKIRSGSNAANDLFGHEIAPNTRLYLLSNNFGEKTGVCVVSIRVTLKNSPANAPEYGHSKWDLDVLFGKNKGLVSTKNGISFDAGEVRLKVNGSTYRLTDRLTNGSLGVDLSSRLINDLKAAKSAKAISGVIAGNEWSGLYDLRAFAKAYKIGKTFCP